jgi:hypothetical protein
MPPHDGRYSLWTVLTTAALVGSAMASGAWYVARARVDDELRQYERSKSWQLPQLLADMRGAAADMRAQLSDRAELKNLRARVPLLERQQANLVLQLATRDQELADMHHRYDPLGATTFELVRGEAREIVPGDIAIGVKDASNILGRVDVVFVGEQRTIAPGTTLQAAANGVDYRVTLVRIVDGGVSPDKAVFSITQRPLSVAH